MDIVRTYADRGKSGLNIEGRDALKLLMTDIQEGRTDFSVLLVYDISRWGRFQDTDEAAYYEYSCKRSGIALQYCAEQFENDGSLFATMAKSLRRSMAGEYSRDLSVKVFAGQCRLVEMGFKQGGAPGIGLRRLMIDEHRRPKGILTVGQQKNLITDRVILVPGPEEEISLVRRIYRLFVVERMPQFEIAKVLNDEGIASDRGVPWTTETIHRVLTSEKYVGHNTFGKVSFKLRQRRIVNAREAWIRCEQAFEPIIDQELFDAAQIVLEERSRKRTDEELLHLLKRLLDHQGRLSSRVINEADGLPSGAFYARRFGSLPRAYELIGYAPQQRHKTAVQTRRFLQGMRRDIAGQIRLGIEKLGGTAIGDPLNGGRLTVNGEFTLSAVIARSNQNRTCPLYWKVCLGPPPHADITLLLRMARGNAEIREYFMLPRSDLEVIGEPRLGHENGVSLDAYRIDSLDTLFAYCARAPAPTTA